MESTGSLEIAIGRGSVPAYSGGWYDFGFLLGVSASFSGGGAGGVGKSRSKAAR